MSRTVSVALLALLFATPAFALNKSFERGGEFQTRLAQHRAAGTVPLKIQPQKSGTLKGVSPKTRMLMQRLFRR